MSWDFFRREYRRAGKPHQCAEAGCEIRKGDLHTYNAGKIEGVLDHYRLCIPCDLIGSEMVHAFDDYCEGYPLGACREQLRVEHGIDDAFAWAVLHRASRAGLTLDLVRRDDVAGVMADREVQIWADGPKAWWIERHPWITDARPKACRYSFRSAAIHPELLTDPNSVRLYLAPPAVEPAPAEIDVEASSWVDDLAFFGLLAAFIALGVAAAWWLGWLQP